MQPQANGTDDSKSEPMGIKEILARTPIFQRMKRIRDMNPAEREEYERILECERIESDKRLSEYREMADRQDRAALVRRIAIDVGPRYAPELVSLDSFKITDEQRQGSIIKRIRDISANFDTFAADARGLVFIGSVGTGKDHLAISLLYRAAGDFKITAKWINGRVIFQASRDAMTTERTEQEVLEPLLSPSILCISDPVPVSGSLTPWNIDLLYRVIDDRYRQFKPTWLTLNVRSPEEADQKLTPPVWDRLREQAEIIPCFWASYRGRK